MIKVLEKVLEKIWIAVFALLNNALGLFREDHTRLALRMTCKALQDDQFNISFHMMPKEMVTVSALYGEFKTLDFAIVMQGPVCTKDNYTLNTVKFYKSMYPASKIIVSTWEEEDDNVLRILNESGAIIVKSKKPSYCGNLNVNYQITNTLAGLLKAKELGCEYSIKTRTDQRICKEYVFYSIISMINRFPCSGNDRQRKRIAVLSTNFGNMFTPYFLSDFLYAGCTEDVINVFSIPMDERQQFQLERSATKREQSESMRPPEIYIIKHYLKDRLGRKCENTIEQYWQAVKECFICFGMKDVGLLWPKYDVKYELNYFYGEYFPGSDIPLLSEMGFDFMNWFDLYSGSLKYDKEYEKYADERLI